MLPHRMTGATSLKRWPALGVDVEGSAVEGGRFKASWPQGVRTDGGVNAPHDAIKEGFANAGYLLSAPLLERGSSSLSPSPAGLEDPVPIL